MWLGYMHPLGGAGNNTQYYVTNGTADLPTVAPPGMKVGDRVTNLAGVGTMSWRVTAISPPPANVPTFQSGAPPATRSTSTSTTVTPQDGTVLITGTTPVTVTLPAPSSFPVGQVVTVINTGTASATVNTVSGTIAGSATATLAANATGKYTTDGTNWFNA